MEKNSKMFKKILPYIVALPGLFLLVNNYPYFMIFSVFVLALFSIVFLIMRGKITAFHSEILSILSIIYIYYILTYFISNQPLVNFFSLDFLRNDGNFFFCYLPFFILAVPYFDYEKVTRIYMRFVFFTFSIFAILGILGFFTRSFQPLFSIDRTRGFLFLAFNNAHNATGSVYAVVSLAAMAFFLKEKGAKKVFYAIITLLLLAALYLTNSRGSILGFISGLVILIWFNFRPLKFLKVFGAMILVSAPIIYFSGIYKSIMTVFSLEGTTLTRLSLWTKALRLFNESPLFGVGFGRFNDINTKPISLEGVRGLISFYVLPNFSYNTAHAHNSYLQFLSETGLIGLSLLLFFWIFCYVKLLRAYRGTDNDFSSKIFLSCIGIISCLLVISVTENYLSATTVMMFVSAIVSLSIGLHWQEKAGKYIMPENILPDNSKKPEILSNTGALAKENMKD
jgi:O-antigen ligase